MTDQDDSLDAFRKTMRRIYEQKLSEDQKDALREKLQRGSDEDLAEGAKYVADLMLSEYVTVIVPNGYTWTVSQIPTELACAFRYDSGMAEGDTDLIATAERFGKQYANLNKALYKVKKSYAVKKKALNSSGAREQATQLLEFWMRTLADVVQQGAESGRDGPSAPPASGDARLDS